MRSSPFSQLLSASRSRCPAALSAGRVAPTGRTGRSQLLTSLHPQAPTIPPFLAPASLAPRRGPAPRCGFPRPAGAGPSSRYGRGWRLAQDLRDRLGRPGTCCSVGSGGQRAARFGAAFSDLRGAGRADRGRGAAPSRRGASQRAHGGFEARRGARSARPAIRKSAPAHRTRTAVAGRRGFGGSHPASGNRLRDGVAPPGHRRRLVGSAFGCLDGPVSGRQPTQSGREPLSATAPN